MYLSRLILNHGSKAVRRDLSDCQDLHRTVLSGFPDLKEGKADARKCFGVLHRVDIHPRSGAIILLVQSNVEPDWSKLPDGYVLTDIGMENPVCKQVDEQYSHIREGDILAFRIRANPTKKISTPKSSDINAEKPKDNGHRVPIKGEQEQLKWLTHKGDTGGFELLSVKSLPDVPDVQLYDEGSLRGLTFVHGVQPVDRIDKNNRLSFASVIYEGRLRVTDLERFMNTVYEGIGSGKAYGFGLLSVARQR